MKKYRPIYNIYLMLMVGTVSIRILPLTSGSNYFDSTVNDIAVGAFASTIVALLIDKANCEIKNDEKQKEIKETYLMLNLFIINSL